MTAPPPSPRAVDFHAFAQRFSATRRGARLARFLAAHQLNVWGVPYGSSAADGVLLVVAELAANAVLHGRVPGRDFALVLVHRPGEGLLRVEVADPHPAGPARLVPDADAEGGRGLLLVDAVAERWGVGDRNGPGKTVWAEVRVGLRSGGR
ncbi:ATP-binding protein [Streptomyces sp. NPDC059740]|uniref:ATP-binding protein n=1 Tax=Streptomyces sp. NPDC059740 TaxID=3346926 RepID=UPI00365F3A35